MNLRGNLLPVFDVHRLLETDPGTPGKRAVLILDQGSRMLGIPLDGLPQAVAFDGAQRTVTPSLRSCRST
jgi:chemotaxis signal transduction protein